MDLRTCTGVQAHPPAHTDVHKLKYAYKSVGANVIQTHTHT